MTHSAPDDPLPDEANRRGYAGDIDPRRAWRLLTEDPGAVLVDVRTSAEWNFVGLPDLAEAGKQPVTIEWQSLPAMARNPDFDARLKAALAQAQAGPETPVVFICRSGARSRDAAISCTRQGFNRCYNLAGGFEGDLDEARHRGQRNGWKFAGLPWRQG
ncbi:MAG: rhodanese-like domain-containing protein [Pseudomonadota bacterium]|jgi:rhodanese-related sulfurtransferase